MSRLKPLLTILFYQGFSSFFLIIELYFLISAVIAQMFGLTAELTHNAYKNTD